MAGQVILIAAVFASAIFGHSWRAASAFAAYTVGGVLLGVGLCLLVTAALQLGSGLTPFPAPRPGQELTTTGAFALSRHPMYGGGILIALGWTVIFASFVSLGFTVLLATFLDLKARREEQWLADRLPGYEDYQRQTRRRLLPFVY